MMTSTLLAALVLAGNALVLPPLGSRAPRAWCTAPRIVIPPAMMGRRKKVVQEEEGETDYAMLEAQTDQSTTLQMVDPMTTSLGREAELDPFPGPPVIDSPVRQPDARPLFVSLSLFPQNQMPCDALQEHYSEWLSEEPTSEVAALCAAHSLANELDFDELVASSDILTEEDLARLELDEAAEAEEGGDEREPPLEMESFPATFVLGHLNVYRAMSWQHAHGWASADPIASISGYAEQVVHQWVRSDELALNVAPTGAYQQTFVVHCRDRPGATELRASTRDRHLDWLRESGRIAAGGPLLAPPEALAEDATSGVMGEGARVGTLLLVHGDDVEEVRQWAAGDPYNSAGLFETVTVAPLNYYAVDPRAHM